jgi:geranylgeranyl reductase family protein
LKTYDIAIVGAGPAACSLALTLQNSDLSILMLEKGTFPRDKVCGDAVPFEAYKTMERLGKKYYERLYAISDKNNIRFNRLITSKKRELMLEWSQKSFNCKRVVFDNELFNWVKTDTKAEIIQNTTVKSATYENDIWTVTDTNKNTFKARFLVGAGGANCPISRHVAKVKLDRTQTCGSVRAYFKGISGLEENTNEIYFLDEFGGSGYLWIFPVGDDLYNVGFGALSEVIANKKVNLRKVFACLVDKNGSLKKRFQNAEMLDKIEGFSIPMGGYKELPISGDGFLLIGDAASLVDPVGGHGLGTGIWSGFIAGQFLEKAFPKGDFSKEKMLGYNHEISNTIGKRLRKQAKSQQIAMRFPWIVELIAHPWLKKIVNKLA